MNFWVERWRTFQNIAKVSLSAGLIVFIYTSNSPLPSFCRSCSAQATFLLRPAKFSCHSPTGVSSLFRQVDIPTGLYSDRSIFRQVDITTGRYSDRSIFRQVAIPTGRYSDRSIFRQVYIPTGRYSDRSLFRQIYIPTCRYSNRSLFRQFLDVNYNVN